MAGISGDIHILHVDDEPEFAKLAAELLERQDRQFSITTATRASEGLDLIKENGIDCVVSDYEMPGATGIDFLRDVREAYPALPFILFTGKGSEEVAGEAISAGVTDYLQKKTGTDQYAVLANRVKNAVSRERAERAAELSRTQLEAITENTNDAIFMIDADSHILFANSAVEDLFGYQPAALLGESMTQLMPDRLREKHLEAVDRHTETGERTVDWRSVELHALHRDGTEFPVTISFGEYAFEGEQRFVGVIHDVTKLKQREEELESLAEEYETVFNTAQDAIFLVDVLETDSGYEFRFRKLNPANERILGLSTDDVRGKSPQEVLGEEVGTQIASNYRRCVVEREPISYEGEVALPSGTIQRQVNLSPVIEDGEVHQLVGVARLTEPGS